uniref:Uncharacterized protein n=1 Tax=Callithrix jacchus TaxID=9483 RepID=A0A8I4A1E1_CALJA
RGRINVSNPFSPSPCASAVEREQFLGKKTKLYEFAQSLHSGSTHLRHAPPCPGDKQFVIPAPFSPAFGWPMSKNVSPIIDSSKLQTFTKINDDEGYPVHGKVETSLLRVTHLCDSIGKEEEEGEEERVKSPKQKVIKIREPRYTQIYLS